MPFFAFHSTANLLEYLAAWLQGIVDLADFSTDEISGLLAVGITENYVLQQVV